MADWPANADANNIVITTGSLCAAVPVAMLGQSAAIVWPAANQAIYIPFRVYQPITVVKFSIFNGATINGNFDVGVYDSEQNRLVSIGSTAHSGANALQTFDITDTLLEPGLYYAAVASSSTTATIFGHDAVTAAGASGFGVLSQSTAFALPATATFAAAQSRLIPWFSLTQRATI